MEMCRFGLTQKKSFRSQTVNSTSSSVTNSDRRWFSGSSPTSYPKYFLSRSKFEIGFQFKFGSEFVFFLFDSSSNKWSRIQINFRIWGWILIILFNFGFIRDFRLMIHIRSVAIFWSGFLFWFFFGFWSILAFWFSSLSQFHEHFTSNFFAKKLQSQTVMREKLRNALLYKKVLCNMLMKLTPGQLCKPSQGTDILFEPKGNYILLYLKCLLKSAIILLNFYTNFL